MADDEKVRVIGLRVPVNRPITREAAFKAVTDMLIAMVGVQTKFACIRTTAGGTLELHLAETESALTSGKTS